MSTMTPNLEATPLPITWDGGLVFISYCLAVQAAYTAFQILQLRVKPSMYPVAAMCLGVSGIWSMHFIGMAAMSIDAHVTFDLWWTVASAIFAFVPCALGLALAGTKVPCETTEEEEATDIMANVGALVDAPHRWLLLSGACIALGACAMHYTGMHSMHSEATPVLDWGIIMLSCLIALFAGTAALYFALVLPLTRTYTLPTSFVAGVAVCGMHYSGMYGMRFELPAGVAAVTTHSNSLTEVVPYIVLSSSILSFSSQALATHLYRGKLEAQGVAQLAANVMTVQVLHCYRKYDTSEVTSILNFCTEEQVVDADLIGLFRGMNENLNQYRPFLPNYLFQDSDGDEDGEAGTAGPSSAASGAVSQRNRISISPASADISMSNSKTESSLFMDSMSLGGSHGSDKNMVNESKSLHPTATVVPHSKPQQLSKRGSSFVGRVTIALLDINLDRLTSCTVRLLESDGGSNFCGRVLTEICKNIYALAKTAKASVHSMLGDTVQLSWNATSEVALHETKGALFLTQLMNAFKLPHQSQGAGGSTRDLNPSPTPILSLNAAISSGSATVHNITAANQQALIIDAPWLPALEGCFALAKQHAVCRTNALRRKSNAGGCDGLSPPAGSNGVILMDGTMKGRSSLEVESCAVEYVSYQPGECSPTFLCGEPNSTSRCVNATSKMVGGHDRNMSMASGGHGGGDGPRGEKNLTTQSTTTVVYQLLEEKMRSADEWMYQLEKDNHKEDPGTKAADLQLEAIAAMVEGRFGEACVALETAGELRLAPQTHRSLENRWKQNLPGPSGWFYDRLLKRCQEALLLPPAQVEGEGSV